MCEITLPGEEYLATLAYLVFSFQEGRSSGLGPKWVPGRVIRDTFKDAVSGFIFRPDLQAFSKTVAGDHTTMVQSLEVLTFNFLKGLDHKFVDEHCLSDYSPGEACVPATPMYLFVKETLKNQRSKVRSVLLTNILGAPEGAVGDVLLVPSAKSLVLQVARVFIREARSLGNKETLTKLGRETVKCIIFMQYVTVWYHLNHTVNKKRCQWTVMDEVLADLRARPESDRALYFDRIVRYERNAFDGKRSWATMKTLGPHLASPAVEEVLAPAVENDAHALGAGDVLGGSGSGQPGGEEDGEEDESMMT
ncbi:uncharacterized protein MELLADRAFT_86314 [Melampsora larici-populina 98AG31]|uniref:Uncharacterized protein n=1 Tax=Melampsora larici-populina (strain 98AG31 / pathotype 3-4-7) TaxID=747676 RepID=F4RLA8_MELLP|nr:uncharacterized protein MELLADRAFT_86314 [Melampsora larici-populina 98AG31]EGG06904.1 hypothetical protein MELLADRAFT_86314 [Melampsora larici-populina 98AG31]